MKTSLTARHFEISEAAQEYANETMGRLAKYFERINDIQLVLDKQKEIWKAEVIIGVPGKTLASNASGDLLYPTIDEAVEKVTRQIERYKAKLTRDKDIRDARQTSAASAAERLG